MKNKKLIAIMFSFMLVTISVVAYAQATTGSDVVTKRKISNPNTTTQTVKRDNTSQTKRNTSIKMVDTGTQATNKTGAKGPRITSVYTSWGRLPIGKWGQLRTTNVPGIYQLIHGCKNGIPQSSYYFYKPKEKMGANMVEIVRFVDADYNQKNDTYTAKRDLPPIKSLNDLDNYWREGYNKYANKSNSFTHDGKKYTIPKPVTPICDNIPEIPSSSKTTVPQNNTHTEWHPVEGLVKHLRTTNVPGVYQEEIGCGVCGSVYRQYYFYNTKTKKMVKVPKSNDTNTLKQYKFNQTNNNHYKFSLTRINDNITSTKDLGDLEEEFKLYGNKTNTINHNGKVYKIEAPPGPPKPPAPKIRVQTVK